MHEIQERAPQKTKRSRAQTQKPLQSRRLNFSSFDRSFYMYIKTSGGLVLWNRARSMLHNGHRPSAVALRLFQDFAVQLDGPTVSDDASRDEHAIRYFAALVIPDDAVAVPSIFETWGRA
jgi:hypothetical protein